MACRVCGCVGEACEQDGRARTKQHTQFPLTNIRFHSNSSKVGILLTLSGASAERRLPRFVVQFPCVVLIGSLAPHSSRKEHARLVPVSNSLRHRQVIEIEAVQIATRELSDQSASSFGHASVNGHFADARGDVKSLVCSQYPVSIELPQLRP